jgi:hypothetical protein
MSRTLKGRFKMFATIVKTTINNVNVINKRSGVSFDEKNVAGKSEM